MEYVGDDSRPLYTLMRSECIHMLYATVIKFIVNMNIIDSFLAYSSQESCEELGNVVQLLE